MTDYAFLTDTHTATPTESSIAFTSGGHTGDGDGWVVPNTETLVANVVTDLADGPYNAFDHVGSTDLTVTIDTGEAMIGASPVARDTQSTVDLAASTPNQIVYVGYQPNSLDSVTIGLNSAFTGNARTLPIWEYDTQSSSVSSTTDRRLIDEYIKTRNRRYETDDGTGEPVDNATDASNLDGVASSNYARTDEAETFDAPLTLNDIAGGTALSVIGANEVDSNVVTIDGDADGGQDDDLLKVRGVGDPNNTTATDSDTVFVTKGEGLVGINTHSPGKALDVNGDVNVRSQLDVTGNTSLGGDLTVSNNLIANAPATINGSLNVVGNQLLVERGGQQLAIRETDTNTDWLLEAQAGAFRITESGVEEWLEIDTSQNGRIEMPGGAATQAMRLTPRSNPPDVVQNGTMAVQNGAGWDPVGTGELDLVVYLGGKWELCSQPP